MKFSPEMESTIDFDEWHKTNLKWLESEFGAENIIRYDTNNMESTRHSHYFGKKSQIIKMQDTYAEYVARFGLVRGESKAITKARHKTLHEWHKEESERLEKELAEMTENVFAEEKEIDYTPTVESDIFDSLR